MNGELHVMTEINIVQVRHCNLDNQRVRIGQDGEQKAYEIHHSEEVHHHINIVHNRDNTVEIIHQLIQRRGKLEDGKKQHKHPKLLRSYIRLQRQVFGIIELGGLKE